MCGPATAAAAAAGGFPNAAHNMSGLCSNGHHTNQESKMMSKSYGFQMPLHYPRYKKADYEKMPEWRIDCLLKEYGLPVIGDADEKRKFAMGAFLWEY